MRKGVLVGDVLWQIMNGLIATGAHVGYIENGVNTVDLIKRRHRIRRITAGLKSPPPRLIAEPLLILAPAAPSPQPLILDVEGPVRRAADTWRRPGREEAEDLAGLSELLVGEPGAGLAAWTA